MSGPVSGAGSEAGWEGAGSEMFFSVWFFCFRGHSEARCPASLQFQHRPKHGPPSPPPFAPPTRT
eukprot:3049455-Alexandrium_andersonii.AAC.1